jgi:hypothetical protein
MSKKGLSTFSEIITIMQTTRIKLICGDNQDKMLAQLLKKANDAISDDFCKITMEEKTKKYVSDTNKRFK